MRDGAIQSVDDPVGNYIEEWKDDPRGQITLRQVMMMTSGLHNYGFGLNPFSNSFRWLFAGDTTPIILDTPLDGKPGTVFDYNDINAELLGLIIERATGRRYADYLNEKLWQPLGNRRAKLWLDHEGGHVHTSCCLLASAMDWAHVGLLLQDKGTIFGKRIVNEAWIDEMLTPSPTGDWYGYQIWLGYSSAPPPQGFPNSGNARTEPFLARDTFYASGYGAQRVYVVPSEELVIVRLGPASGRKPLKDGWDDSYLVNTIMRGLTRRTANASQ
jgi:CubicO group peptidase (beta-lactamase class C family)